MSSARASGEAGITVLRWFRRIVESFDEQDLRRLLRFMTGTSQVPIGGFHLMKLKVRVDNLRGRIPTASTCFSKLYLSQYESEAELRTKLLFALHESVELEDD